MRRPLLCAALMLALAQPGLAQQTINTSPAFYIVLNSLSKTCTVVDKVPRADTPNITVASDTIYKSREEAEVAARTLTPCLK